MKTIGLLGGMSWESTQIYYQDINRAVLAKLGGVHSARCVMYSFDFADVEALQAKGDWKASGELLGDAARKLRGAGADFIVLCTNTMHLVADDVERISGLPLLHIGDVTADAIRKANVHRVGLLATGYTMAQSFMRERIASHGLDVFVPSEADQKLVHDIIYRELVRGIVRDESRRAYLDVVERMREEGAQGIILGCTEIEMLIKDGDANIPFFATAALHSTAAAERALS
jgi:aspartate racemase